MQIQRAPPNTEATERIVASIKVGVDVQTVSEAKETVRDLLKQEEKYSEIVVTVPAGIYSPVDFQFDESDCSENVKVTWIGEEGAEITSALSIPKEFWKDPDSTFAERFYEEARPNIRMISLADFGLTAKDWGTEIYIGLYNGSHKAPTSGVGSAFSTGRQAMIKARYPNEGQWITGTHGMMHEALAIRKTDAQVINSWGHLDDVWVYGGISYDWADMSSPITSIVKENSTYGVKILDDLLYGWMGWGTTCQFFIYNIAEELESEGEWYLDRETGNLYFWPWEGAETADFTYTIDTLISCQNTTNMSFDGFTLRCTQGVAINATGSHLTFQNLNISEIYGDAVTLDGTDNLITDSELSNLYSGGVRLNGGERATLTHGNNRAEYLYIHDIGKMNMMYHPGVAISGVGNTVAHCEIRNTPHSAILYSGNEHTIEYNIIQNVVQYSKDAGAIYAGRDWAAHGTVIRYNLLSDIGNSQFQSDGIYLDDGLTGQTVYGNILVNVSKNSLMIGGGRENMIENNIVINSARVAMQYDDRYRDGYLNNGWAHPAVLPHGTTVMWNTLAAVPYTEGVWAERYPLLAKVKTDAATDVNDPDHPINPSYAVVKNNVIIAPSGAVFDVADSVYTFSQVEDFVLYNTAEEAGWDAEALTLSQDSPIFTDLPEFKAIPLDKIGRVK